MVLAHPEGYRILQGSQAALIATIRSGLGQPQDIARLLRWTEPLRKTPERAVAGADMTLARVAGPARHLRPDPRGGAAPVLPAGLRRRGPAHLLPVRDARHARARVRACPSLPALGMQALPNQMALSLDHPVEHGVDVIGVTRSTGEGVTPAHRQRPRSRRAPSSWPPTRRRPRRCSGSASPRCGGSPRWWFATEVPPTTMKMPFVNPMGPATGPISHALVVSNIAPRYAPPGTAPRLGLLGPGARARTWAPRPRPRCAPSWRRSSAPTPAPGTWCTRNSHSAAWPVARPPLISGREVDLGDGLFVAGDHRETPSIPGAMRSGRRAASAVLEALGEPARSG